MTSAGRHSATAATVALVFAGAMWVVIQPRTADVASLPRPAAVARPVAPAPDPTARDILDHGALLELTATQRSRLEGLAAAWGREAVVAQRAVDAAAAEFSRFMDEARQAGRTNLQEVQRRSEELRELSAALRGRRRRHAEAAATILEERQRMRLQRAMTRPDASGGGDASR